MKVKELKPEEIREMAKDEKLAKVIQNYMDWLSEIINKAAHMTNDELVFTILRLTKKLGIKYVKCVPITDYVIHYVNKKRDLIVSELQDLARKARDELVLSTRIMRWYDANKAWDEYWYWHSKLYSLTGKMLCKIGKYKTYVWSIGKSIDCK